MDNARGYKISLYAYVLSAALMCYASLFFYPRWKNPATEAAISWDVSGYYWYLPSIFIYKDLKEQGFKDDVLKKYGPTNLDFQQGMKLDNGNYSMKYASGMAVMYLPFFTIANLVAKPLGYPADGFSAPYQLAIQLGGLLVSLLGLWYLRKLLLNFYEDKVVAIAMGILVLGSNYLNYSSIECGMSHTWLFTVYVFLLLNTMYFYRAFEMKYAVRIGLLVGLAALTRPSDALSMLIPLLWGMESLSPAAIKRQAALIFSKLKPLLVAGVCAAAVVSIQVIYWKYVSGHWLVYSYQNQHLYFRTPNFENYTFSYRSGWLTYSPMMVFAFVGIIPFLFRGRNRVAIVAFFLFNYYVVCAWNIWWYGGRAMVQSYPVLMFAIAALVQAMLERKWVMALCAPLMAGCVYWNVWVTYMSHKGDLFDNDLMPKAYFWRIAGRWNLPWNITLLKDNPEMYEGTPEKPVQLYRNDFSSDTGIVYLPHTNDNGKTLKLDRAHENSPVFKFPFAGGTQWLRVQAKFHCEHKEGENWKMAQFIVRIMYKGTIVKESVERVYRVLGDYQTKEIPLDMKVPPVLIDSVNVLFWNVSSDQPIWIDDLKAWSF